jgi:hypothetical protein
VNCRRVPQPRWVGARRSAKGGNQRETDVKGETRGLRVCPAPRSGALAVGVTSVRVGGSERLMRAAPFPRAANPSYECPGPSFYRRKERAQVYNGRCSSVLTCLAERS